ncbi:MAG: ferritin [Actinomycetota bacterium]
MLARKVQEAMNAQLAVELESGYAYLAMSAYCESESLPGFAAWLREQSKEEVDHAMRFFDFINDRDGQVSLRKLPEPRQKFSSVLDVFEKALDNERDVTRSISDLYSFVESEKDYAAQAWLDWFATEQVEEEKTVGQIVDGLRRIGESGDALFIFDRELGQRRAAGAAPG